jgi:hypothetical protein
MNILNILNNNSGFGGKNLFHRVNYFNVKLHNELIPLITKSWYLSRVKQLFLPLIPDALSIDKYV